MQICKCKMDVLKSKIFLQFSREMVEHILQHNVLDYSEADLFHACVAWAKASCQKDGLDENDSENLKNHLGKCFYLIRFGTMNGEEIGKILSNKIYVSLFTRDELVEIMRTKWDKEFTPSIFEYAPRKTTMDQSKTDLQKSVLNSGDSEVYSIDLPDALIGKQNHIATVCNNMLNMFAELFSLPTLESKIKPQHDKKNVQAVPLPKNGIVSQPLSPSTQSHAYKKISIPSRSLNKKNWHLKITPDFVNLVATTCAPTMASKILHKKKIFHAIDLKYDLSAAEYLAE